MLSDSDEPSSDGAFRQILARLESREATVGVVGLGYVGLPLADAMHAAGLRVIGFDTDASKIERLEKGESYIKHLGVDLAESLAESPRFTATDDLAKLEKPDVVVVCVPTPLGIHREPDLSFVSNTASAIGASLRAGQLLVLESTTYPSTTREVFLPAVCRAMEAAGKKLEHGRDFFVAYSPEREDPGRATHSTRTIPKIVGGLDDRSTALATALYECCVDDVRSVSSAEIAESSKLLENIFRAVNIALVNELKLLLDKMGIDVWEVIDAASTKPFGFMPFYPGPGLGGHCIPIDPFYLSWKAQEMGVPTRFIELAGEVNTEMPAHVVNRAVLALNSHSKAARGSRVLIVGLAYKADVDDVRESPSFELIDLLTKIGAEVDYSDPFIPRTVPVRKHDLQKTSVTLDPTTVRSYDLVLIATAHTGVDYGLIAEHAQLVVDTRNAMRPFAESMQGRLVRA